MKIKSLFPEKFDKEGFFLAFGFGLSFLLLGILIIGESNTSAKLLLLSGKIITPSGFAHLMQKTNTEILLFILGNLCLLGGVLAIIRGLKIFLQYLANKIND